ncbi:hypothetical protein PTR35_22025 [Serratia nevei]|uniref:hypothetical protein n=1 Tax=Serratia nevei TaxID=2703794 RepID=UPI00313F31D3
MSLSVGARLLVLVVVVVCWTVLYWPKDNDASQSAFVDAAREYFLAHPEVLAPMCKALDSQSQGNVAEQEERVKP